MDARPFLTSHKMGKPAFFETPDPTEQKSQLMRYAVLIGLLVVFSGCSPTTDITRTSTENVAGRSGYEVLRADAQGNSLRLKVKVNSRSAAHMIAEDLAVKKRIRGFDRIQVDVVGPDNAAAGALTWSPERGFNYSEKGQ